MKEADFRIIKDKLANYGSNSLEYVDYEDISDYEIQKETDEVILIAGFHKEAGCRHYHWAANGPKEVLEAVGKEKGLVEFIPKDWVGTFEESGFVIRDYWKDYFMDSLTDIPVIAEEETGENILLKENESKEASEVTLSCKGQSRGFTGQTDDWVREWLDNSKGEGTRHKAILVQRNEEGKLTGLVCTGVYAYDSKKGPIAWIREVAVRPEYQNKGIARRLIGKALGYCKAHGAARAFLAADECNTNALHLYQSIGFCPASGEGQIDMIRE